MPTMTDDDPQAAQPEKERGEGDESAYTQPGYTGEDTGNNQVGPDEPGSPKGPGRLGRFGGRFLKSKRAMAMGSIGGILAALTIGGFLALLPLKLIHIRETLLNYFEARNNHTVTRRMGKHWKIVLDGEGNIKGYTKNCVGVAPYCRLANKARLAKTDRFVRDMEARGLRPEFGALNDPDPRNRGKLLRMGDQDVDLTEMKIGERRAYLRQVIADNYPEMGSWRRGKRARALYKRFGIRMRFFANSRERLQDKELEVNDRMKKRLRQTLFGNEGITIKADGTATPDDPKNKDHVATAERYNQQARGFGDDISREANKLRTDAISDTSKPSGFSLDDAAKKAAPDIAAGTIRGTILGIVDTMDSVCAVKGLLKSVTLGAKAIRAASLAKWAGVVLTAADTLKTGEVDGSDLGAFMVMFDGFERSGGWQRITGSPNAKISTGEKFSVSTKPIGKLEELDSKLSLAGATNSTCRIVGNMFIQVGGAVVSLGGAILSGGTSKLVEAGWAAVKSTVVVLSINILEPIATHMLAGMTVGGDEPPAEKMDAAVAGTNVLEQAKARANGAPKLTLEERKQLDQVAAAEKAEIRSRQSLAWRFLSPYNFESPTGRMIATMPTSPRSIAARMNSALAAINPFNWANQLAMVGGYGKVSQAFAAEEEVDPTGFGVDQYGFKDAEIDRYEPFENEAWLYANPERLERYKKFVEDCLESMDPAKYDQADCQKGKIGQGNVRTENGVLVASSHVDDEEKLRFRTYHFDLGMMENLSGYLSEDDDWGDDGSGAAPTPTVGILPAGSTQQLAQQILANPNITFDPPARNTMNELAAGRTTLRGGNGDIIAVSPKMLAVMLKTGQDNITIRVSSIISGRHSSSSLHYEGLAFDIGNEENAAQIFPYLYNNRDSFGLNELIFARPPAGTTNLDEGRASTYDGGTLSEHNNHIHVSVKP
jgi:hypothetical protein